MSPAAFLRRCWQKQPHLVRGALPGAGTLISRDELFELAGREDVESRLVQERGGDHPWQVRHGPFRRRELERLPPRQWTLLVQHVNLHVPAAAKLLRRFAFVPSWRIDDLMVSYAPPGGGVGPHVDSYDVFLLQAQGRRRWSISRRRFADDDFIPGLDLRILRSFKAQRRWTLAAGDMLYLPPGVAHLGVAEEECITCSVGFRAPGSREAALQYLEERSAVADLPWTDPDLRPARQPGAISAAARRRVRALLRRALADDDDLDRWFGRQASAIPEAAMPAPPARPMSLPRFAAQARRAGSVHLLPASRALFMEAQEGILLFVNGREYVLPAGCLPAVQALTADGRLALDAAAGRRGPLLRALYRLYREGVLASGAG